MEKTSRHSRFTRSIHRTRRGCRLIASVLLGLTVAACAPVHKLSPGAVSMRDQMTMDRASATLQRYVKPGHVCTLNYTTIRLITTVDTEQPLSVSGTVVNVSVRYGVAVKTQISGNVMGGTGSITTTYAPRFGRAAIDMKSIDRALIHVRKEKSPFPLGCADMESGYLIALRSSTSPLPRAELTIHVPTADDRDAVLAALNYLAPGMNMLD